MVVGLAAAAWMGRRLGLSEGVAGGLLGVATLGTLVAMVARMARKGGMRWQERWAWTAAVFLVSVMPLLASIHPGPTLARGTLAVEGASLVLGSDRATRTIVSVTADLPEERSVAFTLRAGATLTEGTLSRGTARWVTGGESRHYHEDRTSVLLDVALPAGVRRLELERVGIRGVPLQVTVYASMLPAYVLLVAGLSVLVAFGWRMAPTGGDRDAVMGAALSVVAGIGAGAIATPERALAPVLAGLLLGLVFGLPLGAAVASAASWLRRLR